MSNKIKVINLLDTKNKKENTKPNSAIASPATNIIREEKILTTSHLMVNSKLNDSPRTGRLSNLKSIIKNINFNSSSKNKTSRSPNKNNKTILQVKSKKDIIDIVKPQSYKTSYNENINLKIIGNNIQKILKSDMNKFKSDEKQGKEKSPMRKLIDNKDNQSNLRVNAFERVNFKYSFRKEETTNDTVDVLNEIYYTEQKAKKLDSGMDMDLELDEYNTINVGKQNLVRTYPKDTPNFNTLKRPNNSNFEKIIKQHIKTKYSLSSPSELLNFRYLLNLYSKKNGYKLIYKILLFLNNEDLKSLFACSKRVRVLIGNIIYENSSKFTKNIKSAMNNNFQFLKRKIFYSIVKSIKLFKLR